MKIRKAKLNDLEKIYLLRREASLSSTIYKKKEITYMTLWGGFYFLQKMLEDSNKLIFIAEEKKIIGYLCLDIKKKFICELFISPVYFKKNIGSLLLKKAENYFVIKKIKKIKINSRINVEKFYLKKGYKRIKKINWKIGDLKIPLILMGKRLIK